MTVGEGYAVIPWDENYFGDAAAEAEAILSSSDFSWV